MKITTIQIIFADKVILYEGDTERMLIKNVLLSDRFETLRKLLFKAGGYKSERLPKR